jgi:hypothetical protein
MGERKVLNKYYPPDFDPAKIPRRRQPKNQQIKVRMMLPMSIRCGTCGNYIYKGTKFNSRKEDVIGETYLGIQIFRFYFKCTKCSAEITMKTDPQNSDYTVESGAARNYEPWRAEDEVADEQKRKRDSEEMGDAMKSLENRTQDSKREMDILAALDEVKSMKSRHAGVSVDLMLKALKPSAPQQTEEFAEEDEALIKSIFQGKRIGNDDNNDDDEDDDDDDDDDDDGVNFSVKKKIKVTQEDSNPTDYLTKASLKKKDELKPPIARVSVIKKPAQHSTSASNQSNGLAKEGTKVSVVKKPTQTDASADNQTNGLVKVDTKPESRSSGLAALCQYDDSDDDD